MISVIRYIWLTCQCFGNSFVFAFDQVVGMGKEWKGGDLTHHAGGGHKVNLLREVMPEFKDRQDLIVMFTDR